MYPPECKTILHTIFVTKDYSARELINPDISGPVKPSLEAYRYNFALSDDFTAWPFVKILRKGSELSQARIEFKNWFKVGLQIYGIKFTDILIDR